MEKDRLIELLNEALQIEYSEIFLYSRYTNTINEKEIAAVFEKFGRMEVRHADNIAMQISLLGGEPKQEFVYLEVKESIDKILLDSFEGENKSIQKYNNLIEFIDISKNADDQLKLTLKGIKSEEEGHFTAIKEFIKKRKIR